MHACQCSLFTLFLSVDSPGYETELDTFITPQPTQLRNVITGQTNPHNSSQVTLHCVELTITTNHHRGHMSSCNRNEPYQAPNAGESDKEGQRETENKH